MESDLYFSCSYKNEDGTWNIIDRKKILVKDKMLSILENINFANGKAALEFIPEPDIGVSELNVRCDGEKYLLSLVEYIEPDGELIVRMRADGINELDESELIGRLAFFKGDGYPIYNVTLCTRQKNKKVC